MLSVMDTHQQQSTLSCKEQQLKLQPEEMPWDIYKMFLILMVVCKSRCGECITLSLGYLEGKDAENRHPKIQEGVLDVWATILGNIVFGQGAMVAAGSLVLKDVPAHRCCSIFG